MFVKGCFISVELVLGGGVTTGSSVELLEPTHLVPSQVWPGIQTDAGTLAPVFLFLQAPFSKS
jgi:hypothetical protein